MRSLTLIISLLAILLLQQTTYSQAWETIHFEDFSGYTNISEIPDIHPFGDGNLFMTNWGTTGAPDDSALGHNLLPWYEPEPDELFGISISKTLEPGYEYRFSLDIRSYVAGLVPGYFGYYLANGEYVPLGGPVYPIGLPTPPTPYQSGVAVNPSGTITSPSFTVDNYNRYTMRYTQRPIKISSLDQADNIFESIDNFRVERRPLHPISLSFSTIQQIVAEGSSVQVCVDIANPPAEHATVIQVLLAGSGQPHLDSYSTQTLVFQAGSTSSECFNLSIPRTTENFDFEVYELFLANAKGPDPVSLGPVTTTTIVVEKLSTPGVTITSPSLVEVQEGSATTICAALTEPLATTTEVDLTISGNVAPHFVNANTPTFYFAAGSTQACLQLEIPYTANPTTASYDFSLVSTADVTALTPSGVTIEVVEEVDPNVGCWSVLHTENFTTSSDYHLADVPNLIHLGFVRSTYGASGQLTDYCAGANMPFSNYIGLELFLEKDFDYRLRWNAKTSSTFKTLDLYVGNDVSSASKVAGPHQIPVIGNTDPGININSGTFSVDTDGTYVIFLRKAPDSPGNGMVRIDNLALEQGCFSGEAVQLTFSSSSGSIVEGGDTQLCVDIDHPDPNEATTVEIGSPQGASPHFSGFSPQAITFPAGSHEQQCITITTSTNGALDGLLTYDFELLNASSGRPVTLEPYPTHVLQVQDDITPADCASFSSAQTEDFSFANFALDNLDQLVTSSNSILDFYRSEEGPSGIGDLCATGPLYQDRYIGLRFSSGGNYEYRLRWEGKGARNIQVWGGTSASSLNAIGSPLSMGNSWSP